MLLAYLAGVGCASSRHFFVKAQDKIVRLG